ncbi:DinB family protein [Aureibacillus halotolerans]|uniref:DinB family protein n=1 Tax=Aureibacillus halotolerans TaxID=1508390 RepID=A0A4R6U068_9BACI|nr:DinB family protein [Aureibacillus halotolerans]TDQ36444.1 DinB family protein [Aureibacillus halotolerans]
MDKRDLQGPQQMAPQVGVFFAMIHENYQRMSSSLEGATLEELEYKGSDNAQNSIAQLVRHLAYIDLRWIYRMRGESLPASSEIAYGPLLVNNALPPVQGQTLDVLLAKYDAVMQMLKDTCITLTDQELQRALPFEHNEATIRWALWHMADHNRYHQAHMNCLRAMYKA